MKHIHWKNLFCVSSLSIYLLTAPVAGQKPASQPASRPAKVRITISRKTTYVLGPLNADGTVNYVAAINKMSSKGVTPKNNAAIPLIKALGPEVLDKKFRSRILKALKMPPLPEKGDYFVPFWKYQEDHEPRDGTDEQIDAFYKKTDANRDKALAAPFSPKDFPFVAAWLKVNEKPLNAVVAATKRPRYFVPWMSDSVPPKLEDGLMRVSWGKLKYTAKALICRAMLKSAKGQAASARSDLLAVHRLARLVGQGPTLIDRLVAMSIEAFACGGDTELATSGELTADQAKAHLADLQALPPLPSMADTFERGEHFFALDAIMSCARVGIREAFAEVCLEFYKIPKHTIPNIPVDWDETMLRYNRWNDRNVAAFSKATFAERKSALAAFGRDLENLSKQLDKKYGPVQTTQPSLLAGMKLLVERMKRLEAKKNVSTDELRRESVEIMVAYLVPNLGRASELYDKVIMQRRMAEVALALAACKGDIGRYPVILAVLKPHYLKKIPNDLFIEKPLHYKRTGEGYLLYSVGPDMKDDGGKGIGDGKGCDDIVVKTKRDTETQRFREKK